MIISACSEPIDITVEEKEKNIVLNSKITPDSLIKANLTKSIGILEPDSKVEFISNADIELYEDEVFIQNLQYDTLGYYISNVYPEVGKTYKIKAKYGELKEIETETVIPEPVSISNMVYDLNISSWTEEWYDYENEFFYDTTIYSFDGLTVATTFNDPAEVENYYLLTFSTYMPVYSYPPPLYEPIYVGEQLRSLDYYSDNLSWINHYWDIGIVGYVISDELFSGKSYTLSVKIDSWQFYGDNWHYDEYGNYVSDGSNLPQSAIYVNLLSISEGFYNYVISSNKYDEASYNPLAEPVNVYSNIENGFGLFTGYSLVQDSIAVEYEQ